MKLTNKTELMIQLSYLCNLKCIHCAYGDLKSSPTISVKQVRDFLHRNNANLIKLSGGEPTICKHFNKIVELCKETGAKVVSFTNGTSAPLVNIHTYWVSLYGEEKIHNKITQAPTFQKTLDFIMTQPVEYLNSPIFSKKQVASLKRISESINIPLRITQLLPHGREHKVLSTREQQNIIRELKLNNGWNWITCSLGFEEPRCNKKACLKPDGSETICTYLIRGLQCPFSNMEEK